MKQSPCSKRLQQGHLAAHPRSLSSPTYLSRHYTPSQTPQTITLLLRNTELWRSGANQRSHWMTFRSVQGIFVQWIRSTRQWTSAPQLLHCQVPHSKAGDSLSSWQTPGERRNPLPGTCSQHTAAATVLRESGPLLPAAIYAHLWVWHICFTWPLGGRKRRRESVSVIPLSTYVFYFKVFYQH